jgi:hypothetical protein
MFNSTSVCIPMLSSILMISFLTTLASSMVGYMATECNCFYQITHHPLFYEKSMHRHVLYDNRCYVLFICKHVSCNLWALKNVVDDDLSYLYLDLNGRIEIQNIIQMFNVGIVKLCWDL